MSTRAVPILAAAGMGFLIATAFVQVRSPNSTINDRASHTGTVADNRENERLSKGSWQSSSRQHAVRRDAPTVGEQKQILQAELGGENRFGELPSLNELQRPRSAESIIIDPIKSGAFSGPVMHTSGLEFDAEQRVEIVSYLSKVGLATVDAERIADSALDGAKTCIGEAIASDDATGTSIETCMFNVLAIHGLNEAVTD